jgi:hypothetical protein
MGRQVEGSPDLRQLTDRPAIITRLKPLLSGDQVPLSLCLGLGKPFTDRTAQIQLALLLALVDSLEVRAPTIPL